MPDSLLRPPRLERRPFAAGDYLTRYPEGAPFDLRLDTAIDRTAWKPRSESGYGHPPHPGAAIEFEGRYFEVLEVKWKGGTFPRYYYYLKRWDERFPLRSPIRLDAAACVAAQQERKKQARENRSAGVATLLMPLLGTLPAVRQVQIERQTGVPAARLTLTSAVLEIMVGVPYLIAVMVALGGGYFPVPGGGLGIRLGLFAFVEGFVRLASSMLLSTPIGSLLVVFPYEIAMTLRRRLDPAWRQSEFEAMRGGRARESLLFAKDEVLELYGQEHALEVISLLPKPHWTPSTGVLFRGVWYLPADTRKLDDGKNVRHRFLLDRAPDETLFRTTTDYQPEEVRELFREKRRRDLGTWVETFAPIWGLLPGEDQRRLEEIYGFDAVRFTRWSILALGVYGVTALVASMMNLHHQTGEPIAGTWLLLGVWFTVESGWRLALGQQPSGSLLGLFVRPFARRFFDEI